MNINENDLITRIKKSDAVAFRVLYEHYYEELYRFAWRRTRDQESSLDIIQDVFSKMWQNRSTLDETQSIKSFLYRSVINQSIDLLRKKSVRMHSPLEFVVEQASEEDNETEIAEKEALESALEKLSDKQQQVLMMRHVEGFKNKEIADILGISVKAVEKRITGALKKLRKFMLALVVFIFLQGLF